MSKDWKFTAKVPNGREMAYRIDEDGKVWPDDLDDGVRFLTGLKNAVIISGFCYVFGWAIFKWATG